MANLREIRQRIQSVENIKQMTQAMEMVATIALKHQQEKLENERRYLKAFEAMARRLQMTNEKSPYFKRKENDKSLYLIISSDKGLCGAYNNSLFLYAKKEILSLPKEKTSLALIGKKGIEAFRRKGFKVEFQKSDFGGKFPLSLIEEIAKNLSSLYLSGSFDNVYVLYTRFVNIMRGEIVLEKILGIDFSSLEKKSFVQEMTFEPNSYEVLNEVLFRYIVSKLSVVLTESYTSEVAARSVSMRTATKNASDLIEDLTLTRNKVRQAGVTKEMIEIISGREM